MYAFISTSHRGPSLPVHVMSQYQGALIFAFSNTNLVKTDTTTSLISRNPCPNHHVHDVEIISILAILMLARREISPSSKNVAIFSHTNSFQGLAEKSEEWWRQSRHETLHVLTFVSHWEYQPLLIVADDYP